MKDFFKVMDLAQVLAYGKSFEIISTERISLTEAGGRIMAEDLFSDVDLPDFNRSTVDGFAVRAVSTFGATEANPAYLTVKGSVHMGEHPAFSIAPGEAAKMPTGGMLPEGTDSVVMVEHIAEIDANTIEVYRSVAPGQHVIERGEDFSKGQRLLAAGQFIRPQEAGLLAAFGKSRIAVYKRPVVGIISTGDEVVPIDDMPGPGRIRDINSFTLSELVKNAGGIPMPYGIVRDDFDSLLKTCREALAQCDMALISGGSSVGTRDFTIEALSTLPEAKILVHGISISPGKPTILAKVGNKSFWGVPGHVVSAMVVFEIVVKPFIEHIGGLSAEHRRKTKLPAIINRNISSAQGRTDFIRVRLIERNGTFWAEPILGKSGLINTMVKADGLIEIDINTEGLEKGTKVQVIPF